MQAKLNGAPLTTVATKPVIVDRRQDRPDSWHCTYLPVEQNFLASKRRVAIPFHLMQPLLSQDVTRRVVACAGRLLQMGGAQLPFYSPFDSGGWVLAGPSERSPSYEEDPTEWVASHLLYPALQGHLELLRNFEGLRPAGRRFADDVLTFLNRTDFVQNIIIPLAGIDIEAKRDQVSSGDVTLRRLSGVEQGVLLEEWGIVGTSALSPGRSLPLVELRLSLSGPRNEPPPPDPQLVTRWMSAMQLYGLQPSGVLARIQTHPEWLLPGVESVPINVLAWPREWQTVSAATFSKIGAAAHELTKFHIGEPRSAQDFALHRFTSGVARTSEADSVVDFVIALEALLLPEGMGHGDLSYRFHVHGAHYLTKAKHERAEIGDQLKKLYQLRSKLVHGGKYPPYADISAARIAAGEFARRGLLRAVTEGFPTAATFKAMALGVSQAR